jgi:YHS domain-containing protein
MRLLFASMMFFSWTLHAQNDGLSIKHYNLNDKVAIDGYDAVSYFTGKPVEGDDKWQLIHKGAKYLFASNSNLAKFKANPDMYEPAYGGWCAYAMGATGEKVKVDVETFKIINGKVYLFYNFWGNNTLEDWNENEQKLKPAADKNWSKTIQ